MSAPMKICFRKLIFGEIRQITIRLRVLLNPIILAMNYKTHYWLFRGKMRNWIYIKGKQLLFAKDTKYTIGKIYNWYRSGANNGNNYLSTMHASIGFIITQFQYFWKRAHHRHELVFFWRFVRLRGGALYATDPNSDDLFYFIILSLVPS